MRQQRGVGRLLNLAAVIFILQGCGSSSESDDTATILPGEQDHTLELSGSVGDGPVVDSTLTVFSRDNQVLDSTLSDQLAGYNIQVRTKGKHYPLTIQAQGGLDLVTRLPLDFPMLAAATEPRKKLVLNVNPFSTLAVVIARQMNGGLSTANLSAARDAVVTEFNLGMTSALSLDPLSTPIDNANLAEIVKSAESLAEIFRRTAATMRAATFTASIDFVIDAIAADLVDGVLDGQGAGLANRQVSAITMLVAAQVSIESMRNELLVNGQVATPVLDGVITQLSGGQSAELTDARPVTSYLIERALQGVDAAILLGGSSSLGSLRVSLAALRPGESAATARQTLPSGAAAMLDGAITQLGGGSTSDIDIVLTGSAVTVPANTAPTISGTPATSVVQDSAYQFLPIASDADGDSLSFSIANRPVWASFNTTSGSLSGTPTANDVGSHDNIVISVSDGQSSASLPAFSVAVQALPPPPPPPPENSPPVISGSPNTSVLQDVAYQFVPVASDVDGDTLSFSIVNQPIWATFNPASGALGGTPTAGDVGTYANIVISVSDGQSSASLPAFSITVNAVSLGSATLSWQAPTTYEDGSPLNDLAGYRFFWGQGSGSYSNDVIIMNPGITTFVVDNLTRGSTYYFAVKALNSNDIESTFSNEASKLIP